jgi:hypothetical protein
VQKGGVLLEHHALEAVNVFDDAAVITASVKQNEVRS